LSNALSLVSIAAIILAGWLLPKYLEARVTAAAKGAVDERVGKVLADHRHELDKQLEAHRSSLARDAEAFKQALALEHDRYSRDYQLFATRRNEVYAETFSLLEQARGRFFPYFSLLTIGLTLGPDFSRAGAEDLAGFANSDKDISPAERTELLSCIERDALEEARTFAGTLHDRVSLRRAHLAFRDFKNASVLNALYYSPTIDGLLTEANIILGRIAAFALDLERLERVDEGTRGRALTELDKITAKLREAMRSEMKAGFGGARP
jgi:hypothetical protein